MQRHNRCTDTNGATMATTLNLNLNDLRNATCKQAPRETQMHYNNIYGITDADEPVIPATDTQSWVQSLSLTVPVRCN